MDTKTSQNSQLNISPCLSSEIIDPAQICWWYQRDLLRSTGNLTVPGLNLLKDQVIMIMSISVLPFYLLKDEQPVLFSSFSTHTGKLSGWCHSQTDQEHKGRTCQSKEMDLTWCFGLPTSSEIKVGHWFVFNSYMNSKEPSENDKVLFHYHSNKLLIRLKQCPFFPNNTNTSFTFKDTIFFSFKSEIAFVSAVYQVAHLQPVFYWFNFLCVCSWD